MNDIQRDSAIGGWIIDEVMVRDSAVVDSFEKMLRISKKHAGKKNDAILIQQAYDGSDPARDFRPMVEIQRERNRAYCERHNFDLRILIGVSDDMYADLFTGQWVKVDMIQKALAEGYKYVVWLDADALIKDLDTDLRLGCVDGIGVCWHRIPQGDHWNTGVMYVQNSPEVRAFVDEWLSCFTPHNDGWGEQGIFNRMAMKSKVVQTISDRWNATLNFSMVPDAVVLGYHGNGDAAKRLEMMRLTLDTLEKAEKGARLRGVSDG